MINTPLTDAEIEYVDNILLERGNDDSILTFSELDGFFTAIVTGPDTVLPHTWYSAIWNGADNESQWSNSKEQEKLLALLERHMSVIANTLLIYPEDFAALLMVSTNTESGADIYIAEDWCFGYMRGVELAQWPKLPERIDTHLAAIRLHGMEENFEKLGTLSLAEHQQTVADITPAALELYVYWLKQKSINDIPLRRLEPKISRNDPCPCGSGKKYKQCCLH